MMTSPALLRLKRACLSLRYHRSFPIVSFCLAFDLGLGLGIGLTYSQFCHGQNFTSRAKPTSDSAPLQLEQGQKDFQLYCTGCHGRQGKGGVKELDTRQFSRRQFTDIIVQTMPMGPYFDSLDCGINCAEAIALYLAEINGGFAQSNPALKHQALHR